MAGDEYGVVDATVDGVKIKKSRITELNWAISNLLNIKKLSQYEVADIMISWLSKCNEIRKLDFSLQLLTKQNIRNAKNQ